MHHRHTEIHGHCEPGFATVKDQFLRNFKQGLETGASLCISIDQQPVVDLWAGQAAPGKQAWRENTIATIFSGTKGLAALCILRLADQGKLDLDTPISHYWPEFAANGKGDIPVGWVLSHRAGLAGANRLLMPWTLADNEALATSMAKLKPWWTPGTAHGYHAITMGWILGKLVKNVTGKSLGQYFRNEIARPLGLDIHIGLSPSEHERVAKMQLFSGMPILHRDILQIISGSLAEPVSTLRGMSLSAFINPFSLGLAAVGNFKIWAELEQPAANGMANARAMATLYGILASGGTASNGYTLLSPEMLEQCWIERSHGMDLVLKRYTRFSHGFMLNQPGPLTSFGPGKRAFGHNGMGGSLTFADPDNKVSFAYVMNKMSTYVLVDPRPRGLIDAFYAAL